MPEQSNYGGSFRKSDMNSQTRLKRLSAIFSNIEIPATGAGYTQNNRANIVLSTSDSIENNLSYLDDTSYKQYASTDLSNIFYPFQVISDPADKTMPYIVPSASLGEYVRGIDLLPFSYGTEPSIIDRYTDLTGDRYVGTVTGDSYDGETYQYQYDDNIRGVGLRGPLMLTGWGYATSTDYPMPSGIAVLSGKFKGEVDNGYKVDPKDYITAPIDFSYDEFREVWTSETPVAFWGKASVGAQPYQDRIRLIPYDRAGIFPTGEDALWVYYDGAKTNFDMYIETDQAVLSYVLYRDSNSSSISDNFENVRGVLIGLGGLSGQIVSDVFWAVVSTHVADNEYNYVPIWAGPEVLGTIFEGNDLTNVPAGTVVLVQRTSTDGGTTFIYIFTYDIKVAVSGTTVPGFLSEVVTASDAWIDTTIVGDDLDITHTGPSSASAWDDSFNFAQLAGVISWVPIELQRDSKGHMLSTLPDAPALTFEVKAGDTWLEIAGTSSAATIEHINDNINPTLVDLPYHAGLTRSSSLVTFEKKNLVFDINGHIEDSIDDPAGDDSIEFRGDDWLLAALTGSENVIVNYTHEDPQIEDDTTDCVISVTVTGSGGARDLVVTVQPISIDAKGHVRPLTPTPVTKTLALTPITNIVDLEVDALTQTINKKTQEQFVLAANAVSSWTLVHQGDEC